MWSSQPLFYLSSEMQFVEVKVSFGIFTAQSSCLALNLFFFFYSSLLPENFKGSMSLLGNFATILN